MSFLKLALLILVHIGSGDGLLHLFGIRLKPAMHLALSVMCGVVIASFVPFLLEVFGIPITEMSVFGGLLIVTAALTIPDFVKDARKSWTVAQLIPSIRLYEWPFIILFIIILGSSVWRAYYFPPNARDVLSGPEAIAEYAVREQSLINSVLSVNLETTNNHLKPPFIADLQIIYKLAGFPFGQIWLSVIVVSFVVFLYHILKQKTHPIIAGILLLLFLAIPEVFGYTYIILFDYSNMVFFFLGFYFLCPYFAEGNNREFYFSALLFGFATWIRSETLVFIAMLIPALWVYAYRNKKGITKVAIQTVAMLAISYFFYAIWVSFFLRLYMPGGFSMAGQINRDFSNVSLFFTRFADMHTRLLTGPLSVPLWGHYFHIFFVLFLAELVVKRKLSPESRNWLYGAMVIYIGLPLLGYLIPLVDLMNTTKRGFFKLAPFLLILMANNGLLQQLSAAITRWEGALPEGKPVAQAQPAHLQGAPKVEKQKQEDI